MKKKSTRNYCQKCNVYVRPENYSNHMLYVHGKNVEKGSSNRNKIAIVATILIAIIGISLSYNSIFNKTSTNLEQSNAVIEPSSGAITEPSSSAITEPSSSAVVGDTIQISTSKVISAAKWYTYDSNGVDVKYFLVKGSDGKIHLGTDACDVCYDSKRGYRQSGNVMTCNNCGREFAINSIGTENLAGGCWPSYIPLEIDGDSAIIEKSDLNEKRYMFE
ncbi:MAG: DUF2318 domain-containing protein [Candidatus Bathyarchaeota archaeon]|nr:DUF2318 domain-containing protein [Candidatus Bathyarchaeota archaeon]